MTWLIGILVAIGSFVALCLVAVAATVFDDGVSRPIKLRELDTDEADSSEPEGLRELSANEVPAFPQLATPDEDVEPEPEKEPT